MENETPQPNDENKQSKVIRNVLMGKLFEQSEILAYHATQQPRTIQKKIDFIANLHKVYGNISLACKLTGIKSRKTVYNWMHDDPEFLKIIEDFTNIENDMTEDALKYQIFARRDGPSIRYYLDKRHPEYMKPKRLTTPPRKKEDQWEKWERLWAEQEKREMQETENMDDEELHKGV